MSGRLSPREELPLQGLGWLSSAVEEAVMARLVMVAGILALTAVLLAGCGGGNDRAKVEASLQDYLVSLVPEEGQTNV
jgi:hypothetical protein